MNSVSFLKARKKKMARISESLKRVFGSIFVFPMTAGNRLDGDGASSRTDGSISSVVSAVFLAAPYLILLGMYGKDFSCKSPGHLWTIPINDGLMVLALLFMILIGFQAYKQRTEGSNRNTVHRVRGAKTVKMTIFCLFGLAVIGDHVVHLAASIECIDDYGHRYSKCEAGNIVIELLRIIFVFSQTGFVLWFLDSFPRRSVRTYYGFPLILLVNLGMWIGENEDLLHSFENIKHHGYIFCDTNRTDPPMSMVILRCNNSNPVQKLLESVTPYVHILRTEYLLLSLGFFLAMWLSLNRRTDNGEGNETEGRSFHRTNENTPLLAHGHSINDGDPSFTNAIRKSDKSSPFFIIRILVISLSIVPLLIGRVVYVFILATEDHPRAAIMAICYRMVMIISTLYLFYKLKRNELKPRAPVKSTEAIFIISFGGMVTFCMFCLISGLGIRDVDESLVIEGRWVAADNFIDIIGTFLLTILILQSRRTQLREKQSRFFSVRSLYLMLAFFNLAMWINDSFFDVNRYNMSTIPQCYFQDSWIVVSFFVFPFLVFYRIYAFICLFDIYYRYKTDGATDSS